MDLYIAPCHKHTSKALRYGMCSQGISQFHLHIPRSSANRMNHTCLCLPSQSWSGTCLPTPEGSMEGKNKVKRTVKSIIIIILYENGLQWMSFVMPRFSFVKFCRCWVFPHRWVGWTISRLNVDSWVLARIESVKLVVLIWYKVKCCLCESPLANNCLLGSGFIGICLWINLVGVTRFSSLCLWDT